MAKGNKSSEGWIKLHRRALHCEVINIDADYFYHWSYILLNASHKEMPATFGSEKIVLNPGQFITGISKMAADLKCNKSKTYRILKRYKNETMIETQTCSKGVLITVLNWDKYQFSETECETEMKQKRNESETKTNTNKKKEERNNNIISTNVDTQNVVDKFNQICISFPKVVKVSEKRSKAIKAILKEYSIDDIEKAFVKTQASDFMKSGSWASFDWLMNKNNLLKVIEGNYDNKSKAKAKKNDFNDFEAKQDYDFDAIEKMLLGN